MKLRTAATLGRISNLPTVWSNVLAGVVLAGAVDRDPAALALTLGLLVVIATLLYVAGMFLNDAFDAAFDARERPERPIPAGLVSRGEVLRWGFAMLAAGVVLAGAFGPRALVAAALTAATIVAYDLHHKQVKLAPLVMGLCRVGLYTIAAFSVVDRPPADVAIGAVVLLAYVLGLTFVAAHENRATLVRAAPLIGIAAPLVVGLPLLRGPLPHVALLLGCGLWLLRSLRLARGGSSRSIRSGVVSLIAGISLVDAVLIARHGHTGLALLAILAFVATLRLQRRIAGT
jgi:hypothetical protein